MSAALLARMRVPMWYTEGRPNASVLQADNLTWIYLADLNRIFSDCFYKMQGKFLRIVNYLGSSNSSISWKSPRNY